MSGKWWSVYGALALAVMVTACVEGAMGDRPAMAAGGGEGASKEVQVAVTERYWKLVELHGKAIGETNREPHMILKQSDMRVVGTGGCNGLLGRYHLEQPNKIRFLNVASTMMACPKGMDVEQNFLKSLQAADSYNVTGDTLLLMNANKAQVARFEAVYMQ